MIINNKKINNKNNISIKCLGSISPYPKNNKNCPGFLIKYKNYNILLDCGNGSSRYLNFPNDLNNLNIFISHYHKDHFGDIGGIQYASYVYHNLKQLNNKIKIYLPKNEYQFNKKSIVDCKESYSEYFEISDNNIFYIDDLKITCHDNNSHSIECFMIKIENANFKVVYTSDIGTSNLSDVIDFCMDADLLICESSFLKSHNSPSLVHLTAYNAGIIAVKSNVKKLVLNHFWPEEKTNLYLDEATTVFSNVEISKENKEINIC